MTKYYGKIKLVGGQEIEPYEIVLDKLAKKEEERMGLSERKFETPLVRKILKGLFFFSLAILAVLFLRTAQLQIVEGKDWVKEAQKNKFIFYQIKAERGVIYDRNLTQMVFNRPSFDLVLNKNKFPADESAKEKILNDLSLILKIDSKEIKEEIEKNEESVIFIARNLSHETLIILETKIKEFSGLSIENNSSREYQDGQILSAIFGYTGKIRPEELKASPEIYSILDYVGRAGIENFYEDELRRVPGKVRVQRDALGNILSQEITSLPETGNSLALSLDFDLQKKLSEKLTEEIKSVGSQKGAAVAMDPRTGEILAMVSVPSYDNNAFSGGKAEKINQILTDQKEPLFNRAVSGQYPIGSSIKPLLASAALQEKIINPEKEIYSPGYIEVPNRYNPEIIYKFLDLAPPNWYDARRAIAFSSNVYFYTIGGGYGQQEGLGPARIKKYLELFGWGRKTGIDLPGENEGLIPTPAWKKEIKKEGWWDGDTYNMSIGQGNVLATPLQIATAFSAIANNGKLLQPQIVKRIINGEKKIIKEFLPQTIRDGFISFENLRAVKEGMRQAVIEGSAKILGNLPITAAAKTGTAETGKENIFHNWVTVFAPYDDPQIVLTVLIEDVKGLKAAASPVAKDILEWYFDGR